ncbi:MAG TPA: peptide chain release factor N(5)-glutamine methyltransferase [Candidatus Kapabacteria bacterium]|jgi:release factor glutamine methyltransferase
MTWNECLSDAEKKLHEAGLEDARINAEYLCAHVLGYKNRRDLRTHRQLDVVKKEADEFEKLLARRMAREPLQYILEEWEFYGIPIELNPSVLIPRPETEILVEQALQEAKKYSGSISILDIGTGSGCIAIALAKHLPNANVLGIDKSEGAIKLAAINGQRNARRSGNDNLKFRVDDLFDTRWETSENMFDLIVSNPPYISKTDFESLEPELRLYEPRQALTDESDGLRFYKRIAEVAPRLLKKNGKLLTEIGFGMANDVSTIVKNAGLDILRIENDLAGIPRVIVAEVKNY